MVASTDAGEEPHILPLASNCHFNARGGLSTVSVGLYPARSRLKRNMGQSAEGSGGKEAGVEVARMGVGDAGVGGGISGVDVRGAEVSVGAAATRVRVARGVGAGVAVGRAQAARIVRATGSVTNVRPIRFIAEPP
jgi:hypothetical protein